MDIRHNDADAREPSHIHIVRPSRRRKQALNGVQHDCAERAFEIKRVAGADDQSQDEAA